MKKVVNLYTLSQLLYNGAICDSVKNNYKNIKPDYKL